MEKNNLYNTVIKNGYSARSGSYSVINPKIKMELDEYGEYSPVIDSPELIDAINDPSISSVCSMSDSSLNEDEISKELFGNIPGIKHDPILGYYKDLYAGYVVEGDYRKNGSSGGIATWILKELLEKKLIDGVIHVKQANDNDGILYKYGISKTIKELCAGSKSRYYPVEFSQVLNKIKNKPGKYAIVGIPSLIMEIRLLAKHDKRINDKITYTLGLICGHQKSTKYAENLAWQCGIKPGDLRSINFRKEIAGAAASDYATEVVGLINSKETTVIKKQSELFGSCWAHGMFKSKFSDFSDDAMNETADISIGDAWLPEYTKDSLGTNLLIVRDKTISSILKSGIENGKIELDKVNIKTILRAERGLSNHYLNELPYRLYKKDTLNEWRPKKRLPASGKLSLLNKKRQDLREIISTKSHDIYKKAVELDDWDYFFKKINPYVKLYGLVNRPIQLKDSKLLRIIKTTTRKHLED